MKEVWLLDFTRPGKMKTPITHIQTILYVHNVIITGTALKKKSLHKGYTWKHYIRVGLPERQSKDTRTLSSQENNNLTGENYIYT